MKSKKAIELLKNPAKYINKWWFFLYYDANIICRLDNLNVTKNVLQSTRILSTTHVRHYFHHIASSILLHPTHSVYNLFGQEFSKFHLKAGVPYLLL